jgi:hypothetical protein
VSSNWSRPALQTPSGPALGATASFFCGPPPAGAAFEASDAADPFSADALDALRIRAVPRPAAPAAFSAWLGPGPLGRAAEALGASTAAALGRCGGAVVSELARPRAPDLEHLRLVWAVRRALDAAGAVAHLDLVSGMWLPSGLAPAGFDVGLEIATPSRGAPVPEAGVPVWTRGMAKLGHPDLLVFGATRGDTPFLRALLRGIATAAAAGAPIGAGATFNDGHAARYRARPLERSRYTGLPELPDPTLLLERVPMDPRA